MGSLGNLFGNIGSAVGAAQAANTIGGNMAEATAADMTGLDVAQSSAADQNYINTGSASQTGAAGVNNTVNQLLTGNQQTPAFQNYLNSTGYQFMLGQGLGAINSSAASKGLLDSGGTAKDLMTYGTNLASTTFNNYLSNLNANAGAMQANAAPGMAGIQSEVTAGQQGGIAAGQQLIQGGIAQANAQQSGANAIGSAVGNVVNALPAGSDARLKHNIKHVGAYNRINLYQFSYKGSTTKWIGVLADEVIRSVPEAVKRIGGYLHVDYDRLGITLKVA